MSLGMPRDLSDQLRVLAASVRDAREDAADGKGADAVGVLDSVAADLDQAAATVTPVGYLCARPHPDAYELELLGVVDGHTSMTNLAGTPDEAAAVRSLYGVNADRETWPVLAIIPVEGA